jgi:hypothetical protein
LRTLAIVSLALSLLLSAGVTHLGETRLRDAFYAYEADPGRAKTGNPALPGRKGFSISTLVLFSIDDWASSSYCSLWLVAVTGVWVAIASKATGPGWRGAAMRNGLKGSMAGSIVVGSLLALIFGIWFWLDESQRDKALDLLETALRWMIGALLGAVGGAVAGAVWGVVLYRRRRDPEAATV